MRYPRINNEEPSIIAIIMGMVGIIGLVGFFTCLCRFVYATITN